MWQYNYNYGSNELYHYGIPGMRWGHRKAIQPSGTGLRRFGRNKPTAQAGAQPGAKPVKAKSKHRINLENKYKAKGMSQSAAEKKANGRIKAEKSLAVIAGLSVAAAGTYALAKRAKNKRILEAMRLRDESNKYANRWFEDQVKQNERMLKGPNKLLSTTQSTILPDGRRVGYTFENGKYKVDLVGRR